MKKEDKKRLTKELLKEWLHPDRRCNLHPPLLIPNSSHRPGKTRPLAGAFYVSQHISLPFAKLSLNLRVDNKFYRHGN